MILDQEKIIIDDEIISSDDQNKIKEFFNNNNFPWYRDGEYTVSKKVNDHFKNISKNVVEYGQFYHTFVNDGQVTSQLGEIPIWLITQVIKKYNLPNKILRIKSNICTKIYEHNVDACQTPHIDNTDNHIVILYYVNDSDGDTFLFNECVSDNILNIKNISLLKRIEPKQGRFVIFNGNRLHAGMNPRLHDSRIVINYNLLIDNE